MRSLVPHVRAFPVRIPGCFKPKLIGEFDLQLLPLAPQALQAVIGSGACDTETAVTTVPMRVFVSCLPVQIAIAPAVGRRMAAGAGIEEVAKELRCSTGTVRRAVAYAEVHLDDAWQIKIERLSSLPSRRRNRKAAPGNTDIVTAAYHSTSDLEGTVLERLPGLLEKRMTPMGIGRELGCSEPLVQRCLDLLGGRGAA